VAARFVGLRLQQRIAACLGTVSVEVLAGRIKAFQQRRVGPAHGARGRYAGGHGFLGLVVVTEHGGEAHAQAAPCAQRLHAVVRFAGARHRSRCYRQKRC
jgi:hypothetical protein